MSRASLNLLGMVLIVSAIAIPVVVACDEQQEMRNFRVVREGVLYRSGQMSLAGLQRAIHDHGITTVVNLREARDTDEVGPDSTEEDFCKDEGLNYHRIVLGQWYAEDGSAPAEKGLHQFRAVLADPRNYPVLVHCLAGKHRTGACCAVYRMEQERWTNAQALAEMKENGYDTLDDEWDILGYLEAYVPTWKDPEQKPVVRRRPPEKPGVTQTRHSRRNRD